LDADTARWSPIFGLLAGVALAAQGTIGPAFIVGSGQSQEVAAGGKSGYCRAGACRRGLGGFLVGGGAGVGGCVGTTLFVAGRGRGLATATTFWRVTAVLVVLALVTWPAMGTPVKRLQAARAKASAGITVGGASSEQAPPAKKSGPPFAQILRSAFGLFLIVS